MSRKHIVPVMVASLGIGLMMSACGTAPKTPAERADLQNEVEQVLAEMTERDPDLATQIEEAYAYVVFPAVSNAGAVVGGAYGRGVVYQGGQVIGYAELNQASIGAQLGAQRFAELILLWDAEALEKLQRGGVDLTGAASAVVVTAGAAAKTDFGDKGMAIFVMPRGGLMFDVSVAGQEIDYQPSPVARAAR